MSHPNTATAVGTEVRATDGHAGLIEAVALDPVGLQATWLIVGLTAGGRIAVPAATASVDASGTVLVPFQLAQLVDGPRVESDVVDVPLARAISEHLGLLV